MANPLNVRVYHGLVNRWVLWTASDLAKTNDGLKFLSNEWAARYENATGDRVAILRAKTLPLNATFAKLDGYGPPAPLSSDAKYLIQVDWRQDRGPNLEVGEEHWPNDLWQVLKPMGEMPALPDREGQIWQENVADAAGKLVGKGFDLVQLALLIGGGWLLISAINKGGSK